MPDQKECIRLFLESVIKAAIAELGLTIQVLPEHLLSNRVALTHFLAEQLHNLGQRQATEIEKRLETLKRRPSEGHGGGASRSRNQH
jgi:hypothetical protein